MFPLLFAWDITMIEVMKTMATSFQRSHDALLHSVPPALQQATADPCLCGDSWTLTGKSGTLSCGVAAPFSWVLLRSGFCLCLLRVCIQVLCKFWWLYGEVNVDLLQEGLCHTQVCCTQSPCPCCSSLLTHTSTGNAQTQFCLNLCQVSGS